MTSLSWAEHLSNLEIVFSLIRDAVLKIKVEKCSFLQERVKYLGHVVSKNGIEADPDKISKVQLWPTPQCVKEVQQFLGLANYYRRFIQNFAKLQPHYTGSLNVPLLHSCGLINANSPLICSASSDPHLQFSATQISLGPSSWTQIQQ